MGAFSAMVRSSSTLTVSCASGLAEEVAEIMKSERLGKKWARLIATLSLPIPQRGTSMEFPFTLPEGILSVAALSPSELGKKAISTSHCCPGDKDWPLQLSLTTLKSCQ